MSYFTTRERPNWCPGCGDYGIWTAVKMALVEMDIEPWKVLLVSGIGCSSKLPHWVKNVYGFHGIHGRVLPLATGARLANNELTVIGFAGDGDAYGIGMCHFIHAMRRNLDITYIVHDNQVYGLTTGQTSPTSDKGFATKSTPTGVIEIPVNPLALALASGATFVARGYAGDVKHLKTLMVEGVRHRGFALIDVLQPCVTFNRKNTHEWYAERVYKLEETGYDPTDKTQAFLKAQEWDDKIPVGILYREVRPTYEDELPQIAEAPLAKQDVGDVDISRLMDELT
ncbi:MAG: thiamine pyrophosphate-dependent enzyme [Candidatus Geothermarchaeales archaeon]